MKQPLFLAALFAGLIAATSAGAISAFAEEPSRTPLHFSGDKTLYESNRVELVGNAAVHQAKESLYADRITLELDTRIVHAVGNATLVSANSMVQASEMHFNLETRTGTIVGGRVSTPSFTLTGERINKLGQNRFQTHRGEYTTCKDCPTSWTLAAEDVDLELDGYAHLSNVKVKIADAPALWIPYLIVPIKTRRQTGLLIPKLGFASGGVTFVQPFFWAISDQTDMTIGAGVYSGRGRRVEWEGRYALFDGKGQANFWHLTDRTFKDYLAKNVTVNREGSTNRYALLVEQSQLWPFDIDQKMRILEVSDNNYRGQVGDIPGEGEAFLSSDLSFTHTTNKVTTFVAAKRFRNLLSRYTKDDPASTDDPRQFDPATVQLFPQVAMTANDKVFFDGALAAGLSLGVMNFTRSAGPFDRDQTTAVAENAPFRLGQDPLREATRFSLQPTLYTTMRLADVVSIVPSIQYRHFFYDFHGARPSESEDPVGTLSRGYLQFQTDLSTQLERVFLTSDPDTPKVKHWIRPRLTYSLIPYRQDPVHPFTRQIQFAQANGFSGYNFDNDDVTPMDASPSTSNYFPPVGHSLAYGFTTQIVRKRAPAVISDRPSYQTAIEWTAAQTLSIREFRKSDDDQRPLSRFVSLLTLSFDKWSGYFDYYYTPYSPISEDTSRHVFSTGASYVIEKGMHQRVLAFERSFGVSYSFNRLTLQSQTQNVTMSGVYSINDFVMPSLKFTYDLLASRYNQIDTALVFQSPSECWKLDLGGAWTLNPVEDGSSDKRLKFEFRFGLAVNLTGGGFGSITDPNSAVTAGK